MMFSYPFFRPPFESYRRYRYSPYRSQSVSSAYVSSSVEKTENEKNESSIHGTARAVTPTIYNISTKSSIPDKDEEKRTSSSSPEIFELFGISLHFDDILLICLLFFLYSEGVQDEWLFISLIMLLLS